MVFIWYLIPTKSGDKANFLAPLACMEQKAACC